MVFDKEFIWNEDHFVYHITQKSSIENIIKYGLIPTIGDRSIFIGDKEKAIYFFDDLYNIDEWMDSLYENKDKNSLEVLRFNLKNLKWYMHNGGEDFYIKNKIPLDKLDYLRIFDDTKLIDFNELCNSEDIDVYELNYNWTKLKNYSLNYLPKNRR